MCTPQTVTCCSCGEDVALDRVFSVEEIAQLFMGATLPWVCPLCEARNDGDEEELAREQPVWDEAVPRAVHRKIHFLSGCGYHPMHPNEKEEEFFAHESGD